MLLNNNMKKLSWLEKLFMSKSFIIEENIRIEVERVNKIEENKKLLAKFYKNLKDGKIHGGGNIEHNDSRREYDMNGTGMGPI